MTLRLVLLTNQFPFDFGDYSFVRHEIDALSEVFDEVLIFNYSSTESITLASLPSNVSYGGNLHGISIKKMLLAAVKPRNLIILSKILLQETRDGNLVKNLIPFLRFALTGLGISSDSRLRQALEAPQFETFIYSFWGMGAALSLPWLRGDFVRLSLRLHGYDLYKERSTNGYLPYRKALFARANIIMPISKAGQEYIISHYPTLDLDKKIVISRLGSGTPLPIPATKRPRSPGLNSTRSESRLIVSCSSLIPVKRVGRLLEAIGNMNPDQNVRWVHFGGGPLEEDLRLQAASVSHQGLTIEFAGQISNDKLQEFYAHNDVDLFVNVSSSEGIPVSIMEAISYNIPILATDVGGTSEIVGADLETGELLDPEFSQADLTAAIQAMLAGPPDTYHPKSAWERHYSAAINSPMTAQIVSGRKT